MNVNGISKVPDEETLIYSSLHFTSIYETYLQLQRI